jgi:hypothetical protein
LSLSSAIVLHILSMLTHVSSTVVLFINEQVIVSGIPQSVRLAVAMIEDVFTFGKAADEQHHHAAAVAAAAAAAAHHFPLQVLALHLHYNITTIPSSHVLHGLEHNATAADVAHSNSCDTARSYKPIARINKHTHTAYNNNSHVDASLTNRALLMTSLTTRVSSWTTATWTTALWAAPEAAAAAAAYRSRTMGSAAAAAASSFLQRQGGVGGYGGYDLRGSDSYQQVLLTLSIYSLESLLALTLSFT